MIQILQANVSGIDALTLIGIGATLLISAIALLVSFHSLGLQRQAAVRNSIEQLDDLNLDTRTFTRNEAPKIKPILNRTTWFPFFGRTVVDLKLYWPEDVSGISQPANLDTEFPESLFKPAEVETLADGWELTIKSADPVTVRSIVTEAMEKVWFKESVDDDFRIREASIADRDTSEFES